MQPMQAILYRTYLTSIVRMYNNNIIYNYIPLNNTVYMCYDKKFVNEEETTDILIYIYITVQRIHIIYLYTTV